jgi:ADP-ribose pyrophosphatase YjhB (NUDIX family)
MTRPGVGIGVIIQNQSKQILIGKRKGNLAPYYSIPGGHLELGETFEEAAIKEVSEETGLIIRKPKVIAITNNLRTYRQENKHFVSVILFTNEYEGQCSVMEPEKCEEWKWCHLDAIPNPQFDASEYAIECFLKSKFYLENQI